MAAAFLPVFHEMDNLVNWSTTLDESNWVVMLKRPSESATGSGLLAPFDSTVWILILVSLIAIGPTIYIIVLIRAMLCKGDEVLTTIVPLDNCVWFVYGALMKQGSTLMPMAGEFALPRNCVLQGHERTLTSSKCCRLVSVVRVTLQLCGLEAQFFLLLYLLSVDF